MWYDCNMLLHYSIYAMTLCLPEQASIVTFTVAGNVFVRVCGWCVIMMSTRSVSSDTIRIGDCPPTDYSIMLYAMMMPASSRVIALGRIPTPTSITCGSGPIINKRLPYGTISLHRCLASKCISCALFAATLSVMACLGIGASSFIVNTRLHPSWRAVGLADLMLIWLFWLYRSNTTCSTCMVSILFQILATTAVVNADTFSVSAGQDTVPAIDNCDDRRICISFFTRNLQFILQHRFTCCPGPIWTYSVFIFFLMTQYNKILVVSSTLSPWIVCSISMFTQILL